MENIKKYFDFDGTMTRSEYWSVYLFTLGLLFPVMFVVGALALFGKLGVLLGTSVLIFVFVALVVVYSATSVKRCRDAGLNPWFTLALFVPTINLIFCIVFGCLPSEKKDGN